MTQIRARTPAPAENEGGQADGSRPRLEPKSSVRLTGRGAVALLFALCFGTQLIAAWTGWGTLAGAAFVCGCGTVTYYTRTDGLRAVAVAPPLLFFAGSACAQLIARELRSLGIEVHEDDAGAAAGSDCGNLLARIRSSRSS